MPIRYRIDRVHRMVFHQCWGELTDAELLAASRAIGEDPDFEAGLNGIVDLREVTADAGVTYRGLEHLRDYNRSFPDELNHPRMAFVAITDVAYGLARAFSMLSDGRSTEYTAFRRMDEACEWVGASPEGFLAEDGWVDVHAPSAP